MLIKKEVKNITLASKSPLFRVELIASSYISRSNIQPSKTECRCNNKNLQKPSKTTKIVGESDFPIQNSYTDQVSSMSKLQQGPKICDTISAKCNYLYKNGMLFSIL